MTRVYQIENDDCMRAVICSLLDIEDVTTVPNFIRYGNNCNTMMAKFLEKHGYKLHQPALLNKNWCRLMNPTEGCFKPEKFYSKIMLTKNKINKLEGVNGYFFGSVFSPNYSSPHNGYNNTHAVVIDKDFNIVHDHKKEYANILQYPLTRFLGFNGLYCVEIIEPIK